MARDDLALEDPQERLRWFPGPDSATHGERGFCATCGSSLFWHSPARPTISITAGSLDGVTGLRTMSHIWDEQRADWETLDDLARAPRAAGPSRADASRAAATSARKSGAPVVAGDSSGCQSTAMQNGCEGSSIASMLPSSAWAETTRPSPTSRMPWWWWEWMSSTDFAEHARHRGAAPRS